MIFELRMTAVVIAVGRCQTVPIAKCESFTNN